MLTQLRWANQRWGKPMGPKGQDWLDRMGITLTPVQPRMVPPPHLFGGGAASGVFGGGGAAGDAFPDAWGGGGGGIAGQGITVPPRFGVAAGGGVTFFLVQIVSEGFCVHSPKRGGDSSESELPRHLRANAQVHLHAPHH